MDVNTPQPDVFYPLLALPIVEGAARAAGAAIRRQFHRPRSTNAQEVLEATNRLSENFLARNLRAAYPGSRIASEEGIQVPITPQHDNLTWWIDPLDGEFNFVHGVPRFGVSVACVDDQGEVLVGVVYDPMLDECYTAVTGHGATLNGEPIKVSRTAVMREAMVASGFPIGPQTRNLAEWSAFLPHCQGIVSMEATALDLCYVAAGRFDVYWEAELQTWDVAAAMLIITEAGGRVSDYSGATFSLSTPTSILATNRTLHAEALSILASAVKA
jgi:myo-inositol-1(or 4)-monophosphatase